MFIARPCAKWTPPEPSVFEENAKSTLKKVRIFSIGPIGSCTTARVTLIWWEKTLAPTTKKSEICTFPFIKVGVVQGYFEGGGPAPYRTITVKGVLEY